MQNKKRSIALELLDQSVTKYNWVWHLGLYRVNILPAEEHDPPPGMEKFGEFGCHRTCRGAM